MTETKIKLSIDGVQAVVSGMKQVGETVGNVKDSFVALTAIGGSLSIGAFATMVKGAIDAVDSLDDLRKTTTLTVEALSGLQFAAEIGGTEFDAVAKAVNTLAVNMGKDAEKFAKVGISAKDPIEAFKQLADVANAVQDPQQRAAFLTEAIGKAWQNVAPLLAEGSERIGELITRGQQYSGVSQQMVDQAGDFNDALDALSATTAGYKNRLAADLLPLLNVLVADLVETSEKTRDLTGSFNPLTEALRALVVLGGNVSFVFKGVGTEIGGIAAQIAALSTGDIAGFLAIGEMMRNDAKSAREAFDAWEKKVMEAGPKVTKQAEEVDAELERIRARAAAANATRVRAFIAGDEAAKQAAAEAKKAAAEALREEQAQAKQLAELAGLTGEFSEKWDRLNRMYAAGKLSVDGLTEAQAKLLALQPAIKKMHDEELRQAKLIADEWEEAAQARADYDKQYLDKQNAAIRGVNDYGKGIEENNRRTEFEITLMGQTAEARAVALAQYQIQLDLEREILRIKELGLDAADAEQQIERARVMALQANMGAVRRAQLDQWTSTWNSVDQTAHDTFVSIFDSGKSAFERLEDTVKNGLLDLLYQMTIRKWIFNIGASVSGISGGGSYGSIDGGGGTGSSLASGLSTGSSLYNAYTGATAATAGGLVAGFGNMVGSSSISAFGAGMGMTTSQAAAASAAYSGAGMPTTGSAISAGSTVAAAIPYVAIVMAIWALVSALDDSGTIHAGGAGQASAAGSSTIDARSLGFMNIDTNAQSNKAAEGIATNIVSILDGTAKSFGKQVGYSAATAFADDTSDDGAWGALRIMLGGSKVLDWDDQRASRWAPREYADGAEGAAEYMKNLGVSVRQALDQMDLPGWADDMLASLGETPTFEALGQMVGQIHTVQAVFKSFGDTITGFASLTDAARTALVNAAGGVESLIGGLNAYYDGYYSEAEKMADTSEQVRQALAKFNIAMPATREEFRAIVEAQMALGEAGAPAVAELLRLAGAFGTVADYSKQLAEQTVADAKARADAEKASAEAAAEATARANEEAAAKVRDAQQLAWESAMRRVEADLDALRRSVDAQRDSLQASHKQTMEALAGQMDVVNARIGKLSSLSNTLRSAVDGMKVPGDAAASRAGAQAEITAALAIARASGVFPEADQLSRALRVVAEPSENLFATFEDYQRDALQTSNTIAELADLADDQLSVDERTYRSLELQREAAEASYAAELQRLDGLLANAQLQYDVLMGLDTTLKPLPDALQALATSISKVPAAPAGSGAGSSAGTPSSNASFVESLYGTFLGRASDADGLADWLGLLESGAATRADVVAGFTNSDEYKRLNGIPSFDIGTNYVADDMLAYIHKGERIMPAADNRQLIDLLQRIAQGGTASDGDAATMQADMQRIRIAAEKTEGHAALTKADAKRTREVLEAVINKDAKFFVESATS